ncbi:MAG: VacJ family lipoprotein [Betaproteobacteria bacterium]|nr:MAG: VacJ family lipoprotein [Betaproteobacteria bacterium]
MTRCAALRVCMTLLASACLLLAGCAATPSRIDPLEPWNRAMFSVHEVVDGNVVKPVAQAYVKYTPEPVRSGVANFFGNIEDLFVGINNVLEGNGNRAGDDFGRVLLNTTFGLGGIFDLASMMGIEKHNQDFGITFGKWGIDQGPYLFVPLFGPTTVRDGTGTVVRAFLGPITYIVTDVPVRNVIYGIGYLNQRAQALDTEGVVDTAAIDKYRFIRNAYLRARRFQVYDGKPPPEQDDEGQ